MPGRNVSLVNKILPLLLFFLFFLGLFSLSHAQDYDDFLENAFDEKGELKPEYHAQLETATQKFQSLPENMQNLFNNQNIEIDFTRADGEKEKIGMVIQEKILKTLTRYAPPNPTLKIKLDEETLNQIMTNKDPIQGLVDAVNNGKIDYSSTDFFTGILLWLSKIIIGIIGFIQGLLAIVGIKL